MPRSSTTVYVLAPLAVLGLALASWWVVDERRATAGPEAAPAPAFGPAPTDPRLTAEVSPPTRADAPVRAPEPTPDDAAEPARREPLAPPRDRARRDALRDQIAAAQRLRRGNQGGDDDSEVLGTLPKEYLRERVREDLIPLAQECYGMALEDDEKLAGALIFHFRIVGEPGVGGIVEDAQLTPESTITHPDMVECMRESMMSMTFDPPENGGAVEVTYPLEFSVEE